MRRNFGWLLMLGLVGLAPALMGETANPNQISADEQKLKTANIPADGPALLAYLKSRTPAEVDRERIEVLIAQLGASSFKVREQATKELLDKGPAVLELLRQGLKHPDLEVQRRCETCIQKIKERDRFPDVPAAVVRLIGQRKPAGAVPVLLGYLPFANNDSTADEVRACLVKLTVQRSDADQALIAALADNEPARRAAAGETLVRAGVWDKHKKAVRALLTDGDVAVRWRVAVALVAAKDKEAVPVLIDLLVEVPQQRAWEIEETLYRLAQPKPPTIALTGDEASRKQCRDGWHAWWKEHATRVNWTAAANPTAPLGFTTIVLLDIGRIVELYANNAVRWQLDGIEFPLDVQVLDGNRVLIAEFNGNRVTERNLKADIVWQRAFDGPQMAQRLVNGNTFIGGRYQLLEVDSAGKQVFHFGFPGDGIMKCAKLPTNDIVFLGEDGRVVRMDSKGKELSSFRIDFGVPLFGGRLHVTPDGHVLIPHHHQNKVAEYDQHGKVLWQVKIEQPIAATRLSNGNTLVTSMSQNRAVEFDSKGTEVWSYRQDVRVTRAIRR